MKSKILNRISLTSIVIALLLGISTLIWLLIYESHNWNNDIFRQRYFDGTIVILSISIAGIVLFGIMYLWLRNKGSKKSIKVLALTSYILCNCAALITIIATCFPVLDLYEGCENLRLDKQLASTDDTEFREAVDSVCARTTNEMLYNSHDQPNEWMLKSARSGYAPAQNFIGVYFHEQARRKMDYTKDPEKYEEELTRAEYWWLKAAQQNNPAAQENLGLMKMNYILSNQPFNGGDAFYWLTEATKNGRTSAYYYLGLLCSYSSLKEAAHYWRLGAEKGNEDCMKMLENPDLIESR